MQSEKIDLLTAALITAQGEYSALKRDCVNPFFKSKYASLDSVIDATSPALRKYGLIVIQTTDGDNLISTLAHSSGQWISGSYPLHAVKNDPQGMGSAITYARRYAYCAIVQCAPSDEDDDGNSHNEPKKKAEPPQKTKNDTSRKTIGKTPEQVKEHFLNHIDKDVSAYFNGLSSPDKLLLCNTNDWDLAKMDVEITQILLNKEGK